MDHLRLSADVLTIFIKVEFLNIQKPNIEDSTIHFKDQLQTFIVRLLFILFSAKLFSPDFNFD